jgi:hypothetical protein
VNDSSFRSLTLFITKLGLKAWPLDVESVFNGDLYEEIIYMKVPQGFNGEGPDLSETKALKYSKSTYELVQKARR